MSIFVDDVGFREYILFGAPFLGSDEERYGRAHSLEPRCDRYDEWQSLSFSEKVCVESGGRIGLLKPEMIDGKLWRLDGGSGSRGRRTLLPPFPGSKPNLGSM